MRLFFYYYLRLSFGKKRHIIEINMNDWMRIEMYKVMVIDNDPTSLAIAKAVLGTEYEVVLMKSGLQALGYLQNNLRPDLVVLDMVLPGSDGITVLKNIKEREDLTDIPVIFSSAKGYDNMEMEALKNGASDFIGKPIVQELLKLKVKRQLAFMELESENRELKARMSTISALCRI